MNCFNYPRIAQGYAYHRPVYHYAVMNMLKDEIKLTSKLEHGLDVGCGAGSSTIALRTICNQVTGIDESFEMIQTARKVQRDDTITFLQCRAEDLVHSSNFYDIITAAGSINWIDEHIFLPLAHNLLKPNGILLIYDNPMINQMKQVPAFTKWWNEEYLVRYPKPPRKETVWDEDFTQTYRFHILNQVVYENTVTMNLEEFVSYILTQTNVIAKVEEQGESLSDATQWFHTTLKPIFNEQPQTIVCEGYNWYLKNQY